MSYSIIILYYVIILYYDIQHRKMAKKAKGNIDGEQLKKDTVKWTEHMDVVLIDALLEQQENGKKVDETFTTTAYNNILKIF